VPACRRAGVHGCGLANALTLARMGVSARAGAALRGASSMRLPVVAAVAVAAPP